MKRDEVCQQAKVFGAPLPYLRKPVRIALFEQLGISYVWPSLIATEFLTIGEKMFAHPIQVV